MKIAVIPIDNRPICYDIIQDVLAIDSSIELFMPDIKHLGGLTTTSNINKIFEFLENLEKVDCLIVSLDTLAYGGLIPSRRSDDSYFQVYKKIEKFKEIASEKADKILGFSSIMRISNNNINEEEKEYWSQYGEKIFKWSYEFHKNLLENKKTSYPDIPKEILKDYIITRKRNYEINNTYLQWAKDGFFDTLIFSKDDCAKYGLNIKEANELEKTAKKYKLNNVFIKTGADEIPLSLISRAISNYEVEKLYGKDGVLRINPIFLNDKSTNLISKYEDISVKNCVLDQIALAGCKVELKKYDLIFYINNFETTQGDLVLGDIVNNSNNDVDINNAFVADINNANGADLGFVKNIFKQSSGLFFGYAGYNTSANTIGASIFCAIVKYFAIKNGTYDNLAFKKYQLIRFLDDWGYQANTRKYVREKASKLLGYKLRLKEKEKELNNFAKAIEKFLNFSPQKITYSLPWERSFEIRITVSL